MSETIALESSAPRPDFVHFEDELRRENIRAALELFAASRPSLVGWREREVGTEPQRVLQSVSA
jgi:hypothetical protein